MKNKRFLAAAASLVMAAASIPTITVASEILGDVNYDGTVTIADLVSMQKYLLGYTSSISQWTSDLNKDGSVDVFDFCILRGIISDSYSSPAVGYTAKNIVEDRVPNSSYGKKPDDKFIMGQTEFALSLFKNELKSDENTLISPYSVMQALAMTANGADGPTKEEMEFVLGGMPIEELNPYLYQQRIEQPDGEFCSLTTANSIWTRDDVEVAPEFIDTDVNYYGADIFTAPFDISTLNDINKWIDTNTKGMIPNALDDISTDAVMYLINAIAFDGSWIEPFEKYNTRTATFTSYSGEEQDAEMMSSFESILLKDDNATGFVKYYMGNYAFAALLPDEDVSVETYVNDLTAEKINTMLKNRESADINLYLPKFSYDYSANINDS